MARTRSCRSVRTTNTFEAMSGRVGALAIRNDGTIILGAAQGGVWTYDATAPAPGPRGPRTPTPSRSAPSRIAPSNDNDRLHGLRRGRPLRRQLLRRRHLPVHRRRRDAGATSPALLRRPVGLGHRRRPDQPQPPLRLDPPRPRRHPPHHAADRRSSTASGSPPNGGASWTLLKGTTERVRTARPTWSWTRRTRNILWASFWGDGIYRSTDGGSTWANAMGNLPHGHFLDGGTRFSLGISHPPGQRRRRSTPASTTSTPSDAYHPAQVCKTHRRRRALDALPTGGPTTGPDSIVDYCGTQCFYDNVVKPDPTNPDIVYVARLLRLRQQSRSPAASTARTDGGADLEEPRLRPAPGLPRDRLPARQHPAHRDRQRRRRLAVAATGAAASAPATRCPPRDWENLNGTVDPTTGGPDPLAPAWRSPSSPRSRRSRSPRPVLGRHPGQRHAAQVHWPTAAGSTRPAVTAARCIVDQTTPNPATRPCRRTSSAPTSASRPYRYDPDETNTFFGNEPIDGGINLKDRAEFYVPWVQNRATPTRCSSAPTGSTAPTTPRRASAGDVHLDADQRRPHQRLHRRRPQRRPRLPHLARSAWPTAATASTPAPTTAGLGQPGRVDRRTTRRWTRVGAGRPAEPPGQPDRGGPVELAHRLRRVRRVRRGHAAATGPRLRHHRRRPALDRRHRQPARRPGQHASSSTRRPEHALRRHRRRPVRHDQRRRAAGARSAPACRRSRSGSSTTTPSQRRARRRHPRPRRLHASRHRGRAGAGRLEGRRRQAGRPGQHDRLHDHGAATSATPTRPASPSPTRCRTTRRSSRPATAAASTAGTVRLDRPDRPGRRQHRRCTSPSRSTPASPAVGHARSSTTASRVTVGQGIGDDGQPAHARRSRRRTP